MISRSYWIRINYFYYEILISSKSYLKSCFPLQPPPAPRTRSKIDTLIFTPDSIKTKNIEETVTENRGSFATPQSDTQGKSKDVGDKELEVEVEVENVERPVDLYKVILVVLSTYYLRLLFSDFLLCEAFYFLDYDNFQVVVKIFI